MWEKRQKIFVPKGDELRVVVLTHLFDKRHFIKTTKKDADKIVKKDCMDDLSDYFIKKIFSGKWPDIRVSSKEIYPLYNIPYAELKFFADCECLKYSEKKPKESEFIKKMMNIRPGVMFSMMRWLES